MEVLKQFAKLLRQKRFTLWEGVQPREHLPFKGSAAQCQQHSASNCGPRSRSEWREWTRTRIFMQKAKRRLSCSRLKRESRWALRTKQLGPDKATVWVWLYLVPEGQVIQQELVPTRGFWGCWACFHRGHQSPCWHPRLWGLSLLDSVLLSPFDLWGWSIPLFPGPLCTCPCIQTEVHTLLWKSAYGGLAEGRGKLGKQNSGICGRAFGLEIGNWGHKEWWQWVWGNWLEEISSSMVFLIYLTSLITLIF